MAATKLVCSLLTFVACIIIGSSIIVGADWCVASGKANPKDLQELLELVCKNGANCSAIQPGGPCFEPNDVNHHASYAFNSLFVRSGTGSGDTLVCDYDGAATFTDKDPSYGNCKYPSPMF